VLVTISWGRPGKRGGGRRNSGWSSELWSLAGFKLWARKESGLFLWKRYTEQCYSSGELVPCLLMCQVIYSSISAEMESFQRARSVRCRSEEYALPYAYDSTESIQKFFVEFEANSSCLLLVVCLIYFSILKVRHSSSKRRLSFNGIRGNISQNIELFKKCLTFADPEH
jgi:hypothetical protein